jgi:hypothetical protein
VTKVKKAFAVVLLTLFAAACGGNSPTAPSGSMASASVAGTWAGIGTDSSSSIGAGSMMGQTDMGTMTWQLTQNGSTVTGPMSFSGSGMQVRMAGSFLGTMSDDDMTFTMDMPTGSMMSPGCSSRATGTAHVNRTTMTMTGTYSGSNSCSGTFANGQMTMTRR